MSAIFAASARTTALRRHARDARLAGCAPHRERGLTLLFALVLLVLLTLFGVSAVQVLSVNLRVTSNMASQKAVEAAAQQGIEKFISDYRNFDIPPTSNTSVQIANGSDQKFTVVVKPPRCIAEVDEIGNTLAYTIPLPKNTLWEVEASTSDTTLGGKAELHHGVVVKMPAGSCR